MTIKEAYAQKLSEAKALAQKASGRDFTPSERLELKTLTDDLASLKLKLNSAAEGEALVKALGELSPAAQRSTHPGSHGSAPTGRLVTKGLDMAHAYAQGQTFGTKSLLENSQTVSLTIDTSPVDQGRPASGLFAVMPAKKVTRDFSYWRQTTRSLQAAVVAPHAEKPVSGLGLSRVEDRLRVIAHLTEPVDKFDLEDMGSLVEFVGNEMGYGLFAALEREVLSGNGTGEHFTGIGNVSGIQTQALVTDPVLTARAALTKLEAFYGDTGAYFVLHPNDWEKVETAQLASKAYVFNDAGESAPVDRIARRLWGCPVALSLATTPGTGFLIKDDAVTLMTDGQVRIEWDLSVGFTRNEAIGRVEGRFNVAVQRPTGVVSMALSA